MKNLTATQASRHFADVLDAVEHARESFTVTRGGRPVATIVPAVHAGGRSVKDLLRRRRGDAGWPAELRLLRRSLVAEERDWTA
ncbi:MAG TPA: type II toxin-antitoxin system Phd/YefM family antitoxin [Candidatus Dormibacteraeota bacterium]|nr:type II toxin-antitoxin system Phd/YefM family antitoxin [Candidatus Dormibacteraeota bacterium]